MRNLLNKAHNLLYKFGKLRSFGIRKKNTCRPHGGSQNNCKPECGKCPQPTSPPICPQPTSPSLYPRPACNQPPSPPLRESGCCNPNYATMNDLPVTSGWYVGRAKRVSSIYKRYLLSGLLFMALSIYTFNKDEITETFTKSHQYIFDFDYDVEYKNASETVQSSLEDVNNSKALKPHYI